MASKVTAGKAIRQAPPASSRTSHTLTPAAQKSFQSIAFNAPFGNQCMLELLDSGKIQPKLRISQPGDSDELEADRVAAQVMSSSAGHSAIPALPVFPRSTPKLSRKCTCSGGVSKCAACEEEEVEGAKGIHRKAASDSTGASSVSSSFLKTLGSGKPLDPPLRNSMEARFGQDFSKVRVHDDSPAAESAKAINAKAFTAGNHIYFGSGSYAPQSNDGQRLVAHELVHVVQQSGSLSTISTPTAGKINRQPSSGSAAPSLPPWLQGVAGAKHIQGNIYEIHLTGYGPTEVGPYSELSTYLSSRKLSGQVQAHHIVGSEHLADVKTAYNDATAPCVALENNVHNGVSARITAGQNQLGGRRGGRTVVTAQEIASLYREVYTADTQFKELSTIADNVLGVKAKAPKGGPTGGGLPKPVAPAPDSNAPAKAGSNITVPKSPSSISPPQFKSTGTASAAEILEMEKAVAEMNAHAAESVRFTGRVKIYVAAFGILLDTLTILDTLGDAMKMGTEGTVLGPVQKQAEKIESQGKEAAQHAEEFGDSVSLIGLIAEINKAQTSANSKALFEMSSSLNDVSTALQASSDSLENIAKPLAAKAKAILVMRDFYQKLVSVPMGPGTAANAQAFAMYESLEKLHGPVNSAAEQYAVAAGTLSFYAKYLGDAAHTANRSAWGIYLASVQKALEGMQKNQSQGATPADPAGSPAQSPSGGTKGAPPSQSRPCTDCHTSSPSVQKPDQGLFKRFGGFGSGPGGQMTSKDLQDLYQFSKGSSGASRIQPKLWRNQASDPYEEEADHVADQVTKADSANSSLGNAPNSIKASGSNGSSSVSASLLQGLGHGRPLEPPLRKSMEARFGQDFSSVRVHDDSSAAQSAKTINAQAFTAGNHIYFGAGSYAPRSNDGQHLVAHELVHVVQQRGTTQVNKPKSVARKNDPSSTTSAPTGPPGCTPDQGKEMTAAANLALQWLDTTFTALSRFVAAPSDKSNKATSDALQLHFHSTDPSIAQRVQTRVSMVGNDINSARGRTELATECHDDTDTHCHDAGAYVSGDSNHLVFCKKFFGASPDWQVSALIHEMFHSIFAPGKAHVTDRAYQSDRAYAQLTTTEALTNADSLALFVQQVATGKVQSSAAQQDKFGSDCKDIENSLRSAIAKAERWNYNADTSVLNFAPAAMIQQNLGADTPQTRKAAQDFYSKAYQGFQGSFHFECEKECKNRTAWGDNSNNQLAGALIGAGIGVGIGALVGSLLGIGIVGGLVAGFVIGGIAGWIGGILSSKGPRIHVCPTWKSQANSPAGTESILAAAYEALGNSTADSLKYAKLAAALQIFHPPAGTLDEIDRDALQQRLQVVRARLAKLRAQYQLSTNDFADSVTRERMRESDKKAERDLKSAVRADRAAPELFGGNFAGETIRKIVSVASSDTSATLSANFQIAYKALSDQDAGKQAAVDIPRIESAIRSTWTVKIAHGEYAGVDFRLVPSITFLPKSQKRSDNAFLITVRGKDKDPSSGDAVHGEISLAAAHLEGPRVIVVAHELAHAFGFVDTYFTQTLGKKGGKQEEHMVIGRTDPGNRPDLLGMIDPANLDKALQKGAVSQADVARQSGPVHIWEEEASIVLRTLGVLPPGPRHKTPDDEGFDSQEELRHVQQTGDAKLADLRARRKRIDDTVSSLKIAEDIIKLEGEEKDIVAKLAAPAKH